MDGRKEQQNKSPERGETLKLSEILDKSEFDKLFRRKNNEKKIVRVA